MWPEMCIRDSLLADLAVFADALQNEVGAQVGGQDDDGVLKVHGAALTVGDPAVIQYLQQHIEHIGMRLFHLIKQYNGVGTAANRFGQLTALLVANISGRRADQAADRVLLHVLTHIAVSYTHLVVIHTRTEGNATFNALLFIPSHAPMNYYSTSYEKGLQLYSRGVLIMEKCADLLPDYFSFVRGLVDSEDLSLNISREMLQHDRQLQLIERALERRIKGELEKLLENDREKYEALWKEFGTQLTYGLCMDYGMHKDTLQDLQLFYSSTEKKLTTLKEYVGRMKEGQEAIYYGCGRTVEAIDCLLYTSGR